MTIQLQEMERALARIEKELILRGRAVIREFQHQDK